MYAFAPSYKFRLYIFLNIALSTTISIIGLFAKSLSDSHFEDTINCNNRRTITGVVKAFTMQLNLIAARRIPAGIDRLWPIILISFPAYSGVRN